ncbi:MAG: two-component sensor histidine kinase [Erythrobacter sp.]|nr:MAG: two-component sensor histidine kinase [Erythrobacter sp.]
MRRFFPKSLLPKSLLGQMLLAVALALLVAQAISAVLIYRAEQKRIENGLVAELAFQLVADPRVDFRAGGGESARGDRRNRGERRRLRIERALQSPQESGETRDAQREEALREVLTEQDIAIAELVVLSRRVSDDRFIMGGISRDSRFVRRRWNPDGELVLAGLKREGEDRWLVARAPRPAGNRGVMAGVIVQTLILYLVLVGGLAVLLRRITRPLAALTHRVESFGGTRNGEPPLEPTGPEDARRLIAAHNAMEARIATLLDEKDVMLGAIGHDLKTPLAALRVRIESVEDDTERARMAATIEDITTSLDDILSLARVGRPSDPLERTDLSALVGAVVEEYEDMGEDVVLEASERMALPLRATWLRRALRNLISNALRYGEQARITLVKENGAAVIRIADSGPGIPEAEIAAMFEPFARGEASRNRETGGAGLGLTLARAIAEQHGGTLRLANAVGAGGAVTGLVAELRLPL